MRLLEPPLPPSVQRNSPPAAAATGASAPLPRADSEAGRQAQQRTGALAAASPPAPPHCDDCPLQQQPEVLEKGQKQPQCRQQPQAVRWQMAVQEQVPARMQAQMLVQVQAQEWRALATMAALQLNPVPLLAQPRPRPQLVLHIRGQWCRAPALALALALWQSPDDDRDRSRAQKPETSWELMQADPAERRRLHPLMQRCRRCLAGWLAEQPGLQPAAESQVQPPGSAMRPTHAHRCQSQGQDH